MATPSLPVPGPPWGALSRGCRRANVGCLAVRSIRRSAGVDPEETVGAVLATIPYAAVRSLHRRQVDYVPIGGAWLRHFGTWSRSSEPRPIHCNSAHAPFSGAVSNVSEKATNADNHSEDQNSARHV